MTTMIENNCNEWELFENPIWLLKHYFEQSGVNLSEIEKKELAEFIFTRNGRQITEAFLCPINRHCTRVELGRSDEFFLIDNNWEYLIGHYIMNGGAASFAQKRDEALVKQYAGK